MLRRTLADQFPVQGSVDSRSATMVRCDIWQAGRRVVDGVVDRVMASFENLPAIEGLGREEIRVKVGQYLAKLSSGGHRDTEELAFYGMAYLRILYEGPDPRYTGC